MLLFSRLHGRHGKTGLSNVLIPFSRNDPNRVHYQIGRCFLCFVSVRFPSNRRNSDYHARLCFTCTWPCLLARVNESGRWVNERKLFWRVRRVSHSLLASLFLRWNWFSNLATVSRSRKRKEKKNWLRGTLVRWIGARCSTTTETPIEYHTVVVRFLSTKSSINWPGLIVKWRKFSQRRLA